MKLLQIPLMVPYFGKYCSLNKKEPADGLRSYQLKTEPSKTEPSPLADHQAEATFMQKERYVELEAKSLQMKRKWQRRKPELRSLRERT